jgi:hypothetical protein
MRIVGDSGGLKRQPCINYLHHIRSSSARLSLLVYEPYGRCRTLRKMQKGMGISYAKLGTKKRLLATGLCS